MRFVGLALLAAGCATAGNGNGTGQTDAPAGVIDAPMQVIDAPKPVDAPSQATCDSGAVCSAAMDLGTVDGDQGNGTAQASGYESAWYKIHLNEGDSSVFAAGMSATVQLTSPAGVNFDLFVYESSDATSIECTTTAGSSTNTGTSDQVHLTWGESGTFSNNLDDSRNLTIEVRPISGTCAASSMFQLVVYGNL